MFRRVLAATAATLIALGCASAASPTGPIAHSSGADAHPECSGGGVYTGSGTC